MAGDTPIRKAVGLPRNLFMAPPAYATQPAQPAANPQPTMLPGQGGMPSPVNQPGSPGMQQLAGMTQMGGQMAPPVGQPPMDMQQGMGAMGGGMPPMGGAPPQWQQAAQLPQPSGPQQAFEGALGQQAQGMEGEDSDPLDDFVNYHAQQAQQTGRPSPHVGFFDTLRQARDRDPEGFYMLLGAVATGDPERVTQMAGQLRQQRLGREAATQQELMGVARERGQRRETQRYRDEDRIENRTFAQQQRLAKQMDDEKQKWSQEGSLDTIEQTLGAPVDDNNFENARRIYSRFKDTQKLDKEKTAFIARRIKAITPPAGRIKTVMDSDPEFAQMVAAADAHRAKWEKLRTEREEANRDRAQRESEAAKKLPPKWRYKLADLQKQRDAMQKRMEKADEDSNSNLFMSEAMPDSAFGTVQSNLTDKFNESQEMLFNLQQRINDMLFGARGATVTDEDVDYDEPPPDTPKPKKPRDFSKLDSLLSGGP